MRVLLVEPHPIVRQGLITVLQSLFTELELLEADSAEHALVLLNNRIPSLVLLEVSLPQLSGIELCRRLQQRFPQLPVAFLTQHRELATVRQALASGASGYLSKFSSLALLQEAIKRLVAGYHFIEPELATQLAYQQSTDNQTDSRLASMTPREHEVFLMVARGMSTAVIAETLCISSKTVANYMTLLKHKLQISNQAELVHLAIDMGLVRLA